jgi:Short C-terminal domain
MFRRRRPIAGTVARTAVVAGTATAVAGGVAARQAAKNAPAPAEAAPPETAAAPAEVAPPETAAAPPTDPIEMLSKLGQLRDQGVLTEEEFAAQKAKILSQM